MSGRDTGAKPQWYQCEHCPMMTTLPDAQHYDDPEEPHDRCEGNAAGHHWLRLVPERATDAVPSDQHWCAAHNEYDCEICTAGGGWVTDEMINEVNAMGKPNGPAPPEAPHAKDCQAMLGDNDAASCDCDGRDAAEDPNAHEPDEKKQCYACTGRATYDNPACVDHASAGGVKRRPASDQPRDTSALREIRAMIRSVNRGEAHPDEVAQGITDSVVALTANLTDEITKLRAQISASAKTLVDGHCGKVRGDHDGCFSADECTCTCDACTAAWKVQNGQRDEDKGKELALADLRAARAEILRLQTEHLPPETTEAAYQHGFADGLAQGKNVQAATIRMLTRERDVARGALEVAIGERAVEVDKHRNLLEASEAMREQLLEENEKLRLEVLAFVNHGVRVPGSAPASVPWAKLWLELHVGKSSPAAEAAFDLLVTTLSEENNALRAALTDAGNERDTWKNTARVSYETAERVRRESAQRTGSASVALLEAVAIAAEAHDRYDQPSSRAALQHALAAWKAGPWPAEKTMPDEHEQGSSVAPMPMPATPSSGPADELREILENLRNHVEDDEEMDADWIVDQCEQALVALDGLTKGVGHE